MISALVLTFALGAAPPPPSTLDRFMRRYDKNRDGYVDRNEWPGPRAAFARLDANSDGKLSRKELARAGENLARFLDGKGGKGEVNTPAARGERRPDRLKVGDVAPDFTLPDLSGKKQVKLSSFRDKRP